MNFDWKNPDYASVFRKRAAMIARMRAEPAIVPQLKLYYRDNPADFINDFGMTSDPRNVEIGLPVNVPFLLFPKQREWVEWVIDRWKGRVGGATVKSRDMGISWLMMALFDTLCLFNNDLALGVGSRKLDLVDKIGDPKTLFWKARKFLEFIPAEFAVPYSSKEGLIAFANGSTIAGEGGDEIGRGARTAIYGVDEAASLVHPTLTDAALSQTTNCQIDISTPKGLANPFALKAERKSPYDKRDANSVFKFHWRDDPRKDQAWYDRQVIELADPVIIAQEIDMDFSASVEGVVIPSAWVQAAIDIHTFLGIEPTGARKGALDVADEGRDLNAFAASYGMMVTYLEEWSGAGSDIFKTTQRAIGIAEANNLQSFEYDADGLGAGVRGDANQINEQRLAIKRAAIAAVPYRGSGAVTYPEASDVKGRLNKDFFKNLKAQRWWGARRRFEHAWRARKGEPYDEAMLVSLPSDLPLLTKLQGELSQATYSEDAQGKLIIDKTPDGARSPNLADAVIMLIGSTRRGLVISPEAFAASEVRTI